MKLKTIWLWSGVWKVALAVEAAAAFCWGLSILLKPSPIVGALLGSVIGMSTAVVSMEIWPCWRFEWR